MCLGGLMTVLFKITKLHKRKVNKFFCTVVFFFAWFPAEITFNCTLTKFHLTFTKWFLAFRVRLAMCLQLENPYLLAELNFKSSSFSSYSYTGNFNYRSTNLWLSSSRSSQWSHQPIMGPWRKSQKCRW